MKFENIKAEAKQIVGDGSVPADMRLVAAWMLDILADSHTNRADVDAFVMKLASRETWPARKAR